ncbi:hypothetical protein AGABI1DRAFT_120484 [Agaricus bisporus var. burnettii JB137-S8]|uniref:AB hydrolase-1 domain-containing protein n=1 Tax=Agaricus bisporus var. burnettii (strain JB137-S8 / ATCC MYA-4627 / FGSC 10392) TaxID=597362 RepID=K5XBI9_AGABU|nr:uncharacterized protein AGABI1DRAFT_120484 [Agaricus bisporus var. burnettii JB137-S8]EKM80472.1 hypothetical protein AGABI1DRAFT_120484 [Agaricus bisporus var. burnettii JB137-S8]
MDYLPPAKAIPNAFLASAKSWWAVGEKQATISEARLLRRLPFYSPSNTPSPSQPVVATSTRVELDAPKHYINTVSITPTAPASGAVSPTPTVLLHGYGAGLAFYFRNLSALATWAGKKGASVYAIDWLGMSLSARVPFSIRARRDDISGRVHEAESFFVDSLEEWRKKMNLSKMTLVAHSLGAYFSVVYALRYPDRVSRLVLLSPAGVPRGPNFSQPSRELTDEGAGAPVSNGDHKSIESPSKKRVEEIRDHQRDNQRQQSRARRLFMYLWEEGWSPFQVVRATTLWGPMLVGKYSARRFAGLSEEETRDMHDYILNITLAKASSEYCISHLLQPGAHAHMPLVDRIGELKIPITFIYGDNDWMDPEGGVQSVEKLRQAGNGQGKMYLVGNAGHHVYLDNHVATNELIIKELEREYEKVAAARS